MVFTASDNRTHLDELDQKGVEYVKKPFVASLKREVRERILGSDQA